MISAESDGKGGKIRAFNLRHRFNGGMAIMISSSPLISSPRICMAMSKHGFSESLKHGELLPLPSEALRLRYVLMSAGRPVSQTVGVLAPCKRNGSTLMVA
jgi:hypothetical protein